MSLIVIFENILSEFIKLTSFMKKGIDFSPLLCYSIIKKKSNLIFLALSFQLNTSWIIWYYYLDLKDS